MSAVTHVTPRLTALTDAGASAERVVLEDDPAAAVHAPGERLTGLIGGR